MKVMREASKAANEFGFEENMVTPYLRRFQRKYAVFGRKTA